jgi:hypothetical protein
MITPLFSLIACPKEVYADTISNTGSCTIIIQGSNNTVKHVECVPTAQPGATVVRSRYMPEDTQNPSQPALLHPLVIRDDQGQTQKLTIFFVYPLSRADGSFMSAAQLIMVYAYQTTSTGRYDPPPGTFPTFSGSWGPGAQVKVELSVPTSYFEETSGWNLRLCIGSRAQCVFTPNLLSGSRVTG